MIISYYKQEEDIYYPEKFVKYVLDDQGYNLQYIIRKYFEFENKQIAGFEMHCYERYFLYIFDDLIFNYRSRLKNNRITENENRIKTEQELEDLKLGAQPGFEPVFKDVPGFSELKKINRFTDI